MTPSDVPVLLIVFRRPRPTAEVLDALRAVRPTRLYVAGDGPRPGRSDDAAGVAETRAVIEGGVDWPTDLRTRFRDANLGCRRGVVDAIDWFLGEVGEGVILEDDCVPHPDFFAYCADLLDRYRDDERVWCISGDNSAGVRFAADASYGFVRFPQIWGWATWSRAWSQYDRDLDRWAALRGTRAVRRLLRDPVERTIVTGVLDRLRDEGVPDTWDYQWMASCLMGGGRCALPRVNLISNVGFGLDATHTVRSNARAGVATDPILPLVHPSHVDVDRRADRELFDRTQGGKRLRKRRPTAQVVRLLRAVLARLTRRDRQTEPDSSER